MKTMIIAALLAVTIHGKVQAASAPAQPRILPAGTEVSGAAGKPGSVDIYSFMTLPGDTHSITARSTSKKPLQLQLLDPGGNAIMQASGVGEVSLQAITSWGDAYSVAVIRSDTTAKYSIKRMATAGTLQQFVLSHMAGYTRTEGLKTTRCWIEPGSVIRVLFDTFIDERAIVGLRQDSRRVSRSDGRTHLASAIIAVEGDEIAITEEEEGEKYKQTLSFKPERIRYSPEYKFTGYRCSSQP